MDVWENLKNFFLGEPEEDYEEGNEEEYEDEYEDEVSNGGAARSIGSAFSGLSQRFGFGGSGAAKTHQQEEPEPVQSTSNRRNSYSSARSSYGSSYSSGMYNSSRNASNVVNFNTSVNMQVVVVSPKNLDEAGEASLQLKQKVVIVNLEGVEKDMAQRITDFFSGATYALNGSIKPISARIFLIAPYDVSISGQFKRDLEASGIKLPNSPMFR